MKPKPEPSLNFKIVSQACLLGRAFLFRTSIAKLFVTNSKQKASRLRQTSFMAEVNSFTVEANKPLA
jgi:hypothetical protein